MRLHPAAVAALLAALTVALTWPQARDIATAVSDFGDPLLNSWTLGWIADALATRPARLFHANIFHPETFTLAYSETMLLPGVMVAPLVWMGGDPILAHNILLLASPVLSGLTMFLLVRRLTGRDSAALVSAIVFAFYPYRIEHYAKVQLQLTWWLPLLLLAVHRLLDELSPFDFAQGVPSASRGTWRWAVAVGAIAAAQVYTCVYYGVFGAIVMGVVVMVLATGVPREARVRLLMMLVLAAVTGALLTAPIAMAYQSASRTVGARRLHEGERGSARPSDYLQPNPENALYGDRRHPGIAERRLFPGYVSPLLAAAALVPPFRLVPIAYAAGGAAAFDLSLGLNGLTYRRLYEWFPPLKAVRVPARFGMLVGLATAVLAGLGIARISRGRSTRIETAIALAAILAVIVESRMRPPELVEFDDPMPAVYTWLAEQPPAVVCEYPVGNLEGRAGPQDATYMYYSTRHWQPLVNGFSGFSPPWYDRMLEALADFPDDRSIAHLRERGVTHLLVHSVFYIRGDFAADVSVLRARPDLEWVGTFPWKGGGTTDVFRVRY